MKPSTSPLSNNPSLFLLGCFFPNFSMHSKHVNVGFGFSFLTNMGIYLSFSLDVLWTSFLIHNPEIE